MAISRAFVASAVLVLCASPVPAQWNVQTAVDRLDANAGRSFAVVEAKQTFQQFGQAVRVHLVVSCRDAITSDGSARDFKQYGAEISFSETVAIGPRLVRWRVDGNKVGQFRQAPLNDGKIFSLYQYMGRDGLSAQLKNARRLTIEADLPWAGDVLLEFDVAGGSDAFAKVPCSRPVR